MEIGHLIEHLQTSSKTLNIIRKYFVLFLKFMKLDALRGLKTYAQSGKSFIQTVKDLKKKEIEIKKRDMCQKFNLKINS